jgi:hypothetical protein
MHPMNSTQTARHLSNNHIWLADPRTQHETAQHRQTKQRARKLPEGVGKFSKVPDMALPGNHTRCHGTQCAAIPLRHVPIKRVQMIQSNRLNHWLHYRTVTSWKATHAKQAVPRHSRAVRQTETKGGLRAGSAPNRDGKAERILKHDWSGRNRHVYRRSRERNSGSLFVVMHEVDGAKRWHAAMHGDKTREPLVLSGRESTI